MALTRIAERFAADVRRATKGKLSRFALRSDAKDEAADTLGAVAFDTRGIYGATAGPVDKTTRHSKGEFQRLKIKLPPKDEPDLGSVAKRWRREAADRVEAILESERQTIIELLRDSENRTPENRTPEQLQDRIDERLLTTRSKLQSAARDDVLTLNSRINAERQQAAGIEEFEWTTAGDGPRVRESHQELDGKRFRWDDPPIVDGEPALPGEPDNCRCVPTPVLPELEE